MSAAERLMEYVEDLEHGRLSLTEVADRIGVSKQRVSWLCVQRKIAALQPRMCRQCHTRLSIADRDRQPRKCTACQPRLRVLVRMCDQCKKVYGLTGKARRNYLKNKNGRHKVQRSRCPECKAAAKGFRDLLTVPCADCGAEAQYRRYELHNRLRAGKGAVCRACVVRHQAEGRRRAWLLRVQSKREDKAAV